MTISLNLFHKNIQLPFFILLISVITGCNNSDDDVKILLDPDEINVTLVTPLPNWIQATKPGENIEFTGEVTGLSADSYQHISAFLYSDQDGIIHDGELDENGHFLFESTSLSDVAHQISFGITNGTDTISSGSAWVLNGHNIDFMNPKVGQKSLYTKWNFTRGDCQSITRSDRVVTLEISEQEGSTYTILRRRLGRLYSGYNSEQFTVKNDTIRFLDEHTSLFDMVTLDSKKLPANDITSNPSTLEGWCSFIDPDYVGEEVLYGHTKNFQHYGTTYEHLNVINEHIGSSSDHPIVQIAYGPSEGIVRCSIYAYSVSWGIFWELIP